MHPSFDSQKSLFQSIAEWLEDTILAGIYTEESQVPSITEISVQYKINPATALKGVNMLVESGLLYKKRGMGMFVSEGARVKLLQQRHQLFFTDYIKPLVDEASRLEIGKKELKDMIERGYDHDN
ncbi:MAG: GntR family transcriptional regulator [Oscillospiraceae bacterium]|nr:GntR family transcriptional regulator [Oscillospiraceae bacterium]